LFQKNFGKSQALHAGFAKAQGEVIITMDADLQDSPEEIPGLYNMITSQTLIWFPVGRKALRFSGCKTYLQNYSTGRLEKRLG
jgi:glycosyltransferase involved in cell wall biosynthesis